MSTSRSMWRTFGISLMMLVGLAPASAAQIWQHFETELGVAVGTHQFDGRDLRRRPAVAARVRQTVLTYAFLEAEASVANVCQEYNTLPIDPPCGATEWVSYMTIGGGLQVPVGRLRPYAGLTFGRQHRQRTVQRYGPPVDSRSVFLGAAGQLRPRISIHAEYRTRRQTPDLVLQPIAFANRPSSQWLVGISARLF